MPIHPRQLLEMALVGYEERKRRLDQTIAEIRSQLGNRGTGKRGASATKVETPVGRKRVLSPAARKRIAAAQKKRWAAFKREKAAKQQQKPEVERKSEEPRPRRTMSAAARKNIGDAARKRWAARRKTA
jgi:hypothetical protein